MTWGRGAGQGRPRVHLPLQPREESLRAPKTSHPDLADFLLIFTPPAPSCQLHKLVSGAAMGQPPFPPPPTARVTHKGPFCYAH